jgi:hypothetical protein
MSHLRLESLYVVQLSPLTQYLAYVNSDVIPKALQCEHIPPFSKLCKYSGTHIQTQPSTIATVKCAVYRTLIHSGPITRLNAVTIRNVRDNGTRVS